MKKIFIPIIVLLLLSAANLQSQMESHVTSTADDEFAHSYDFIVTPGFDESSDGICEDSLHRCTLRAAIEEAGNLGLAAYIYMETNGAIHMDPHQTGFYLPDNSIVIASGFRPVIEGNLEDVIFTVGNNVILYGFLLVNALYGIFVAGNDNLIGSVTSNKNYIYGMEEAAILVAGDNNRIVGNWIGLNELGEAAGFSPYGIFITGKENVIGGNGFEQGNVISGNDIGIGVHLVDTTSNHRNYIIGNFIGTDPAGTKAIPNRVGIDNIGQNLSIGGLTIPDANVISGNTESGILFGGLADGNLIGGNLIGVDKNGTLPLPNRDGITLGPGTFNTIVEQNIIAHNTENGISISGIPDPLLKAKNNIIRGNEIFSNGNAGVAISGAAENNIIGSSLLQNYSPNQIDSNGAFGILIAPGFGNPQRNTFRENSFQDNTGFGIRIFGGQGGIQPPMLESYTDDGQGTAIIIGTHSLAGAIIDLYAGDANQSLRQEGVQWLGSGPVDASGFFSIQITSCPCEYIVATATDAIGNTSEFSNGFQTITSIQDPPSLIGNISVYPNPFNKMTTIEYELDQPGDISLSIYDLTGRKLETLFQGHQQPGKYQSIWNSNDKPSGIYYFQLNAGNLIYTGRLVYLK